MRKTLIVVAVAILAACTASNIGKAQEAADLVKKNCGVIVSIADIAAAFSAPNPAVTTVAAMAHAICAQADRTENGALEHYRGFIVPVHHEWAQVEQPEPPPMPNPDPPVMQPEEVEPAPEPAPLPPKETDACVAIVNGVCIHKEGDK